MQDSHKAPRSFKELHLLQMEKLQQQQKDNLVSYLQRQSSSVSGTYRTEGSGGNNTGFRPVSHVMPSSRPAGSSRNSQIEKGS